MQWYRLQVSFQEIDVVEEQSFVEFLDELGEWASEDEGMDNDTIGHQEQETAAAVVSIPPHTKSSIPQEILHRVDQLI
jgi:hypothetical protein